MTAGMSPAPRRLNAGIAFACAIGLGLSCYAYIVEIKKEADDSYQALCDISERVSCTKVFMSKHGKGFGLIPKDSVLCAPNPVYGFGFYTLLAILSMINNYACSVALVALALCSNIMSVYLAYILYIYDDICVVCVCTYIVNAIIMFLSVKKLHKLSIGDVRKVKMK